MSTQTTVLLRFTTAFLAIGMLAAQQAGRDAPAKPTVGTAVLAGSVVDAATGKPLRRVTVTLSASVSGLVPRMATTDDAGRFIFTGLPAGGYGSPRANKVGFVTASYGEKKVNGTGTPIALGDGQRLVISIAMTRAAVISGVVLDQGHAVSSTAVSATLVRTINGERVPSSGFASRAYTDDRGMYRAANLAPGDYLVMASPRLGASGDVRPVSEDELRWAQQQLAQTAGSPAASTAPLPHPAPAVAYTPVFYPGVTEVGRASIVTVTAGEERGGVDFSLQFVATARLEGTLIDPEGQPVQTAQINVIPKLDSPILMSDPLFIMDAALLNRAVVNNGKFSIAGLRPGAYTLSARAAPRAIAGRPAPSGRGGGPAPMTLWATADVTVNGADQSGIQMQLQPGMELSGRISFEGGTLQPPADLSRVTVRMSAAPSPTGVTVSMNPPTAVVSADGKFTLEGVTPGRFYLSASAPLAAPAPGTGWTLKSARVGDIDAADVPFEVRPSQNLSDVVITFTDKSSELSGTLVDAAGRPTPDFSIMLFPVNRSMWSQQSRRLRPPTRAGADGRFKFTNVLPGEYYLAALGEYEAADVFKAEFLEQVASAAMKVTLAEGEKKVQDLKIAGSVGHLNGPK